MKNKFAEAIKVFGLFYFFINILVTVSFVIFAIQALINGSISSGFIVLILPVAGIFCGYWMRQGTYGWWRISIISISLFLSTAILFTVFFISPKLEQQKHEEFMARQQVHQADINGLFDAIYDNNISGVQSAIDRNVNMNVKNITGESTLHAAQDINILKLLISKGADINTSDGAGMTPIFNKDIDLIKTLVQAGADVMHISQKGNSTIIWYAYSGYIEAIQYMVSLGVDINTINSDGQTAYDIAETFGHLKLLRYLKSIGAKSSNLKPQKPAKPVNTLKTKY